MTDMLQLALDSLREYEKGLGENEGLHNVARLAEMRIGFAQALELRRIANAIEAAVRAAEAADLTPHDLGE